MTQTGTDIAMLTTGRHSALADGVRVPGNGWMTPGSGEAGTAMNQWRDHLAQAGKIFPGATPARREGLT
jgi:hypothetical protein